MLYRFTNEHLIFKDPITLKEQSFELPGIQDVDFVTINKDGSLIALAAFDEENNGEGIFLCDLNRGSVKQIYNKQAYDLVFAASGNGLYYNEGNSIFIIDLKTGNTSKVFKFSRIENAPISLSLNPQGNFISYHKWKSDNRRLFTYDLLNNIESDMGKSFFDYSWLDPEHLIYSLCSGISILNINTKKSERIIWNLHSLFKQYKEANNYAINEFKDIDLVVDEISKPIFNDERIYFKLFVSNKEEKHIGIYSITKNKTDLRCHFSSEQGLIRDFGILHDGKTIYIFIEPNRLKNETINYGVIYMRDNQIIEFAGWLPVKPNSKPTASEIR